MRIGLIGFGSIGKYLAANLGSELVWIVDSDASAKERMAATGVKCNFYTEVPKGCGGADLVVEAASQQALPLVLPCLEHCDVMIMSVGALADGRVLLQLKAAAEKHGRKIYLPSGAIGGLDAISAVAGSAKEVVLETTKSPASLGRNDTARTVIYEGNAAEACRLYPKNVNISATLALAGIGFEKTWVRIISDPSALYNSHRIFVKSDAGRMTFEFENLPSKENPKTSALAAMAALARIRKIKETLQIG
ncbi:MAG: aspartate dehydrogenase [Candidatus Anstonellaceae archaeon]